jgi:poly(3-hydroxybutyrate) depolymerase
MEKLLDRVLFVVIAFSMVLASPAHATDFCKNPIGRRLFSKVCAKQASGGDSSAPTDVGGAKGGPAVEANTTVISHSEDAVGALRAAYSNHRGELVTINTAFDDAAIQRELRVYFPKTPPPEKGYAVILAFHGRGQTAEYASRYMGLTDTTNNLAEAGAFIVIYPQGWEYELAAPPESNSSRLGRRRSPQRLAETQTTDGGRQNRVSGWAVMPGAANPVNDFAFVDTILKSLTQVENLRIDPKRIGATGFSNGAIFTESLICTDARISAAAVVAGAAQRGGMVGVA